MNITAGGGPIKSVSIAGVTVTTEEASQIDLRGGGDLTAYRWITGTGGTTDILASDDSYAVIPGFSSRFSPYSPGYLNSNLADSAILFADSSTSNNGFGVGSRIHLDAGSGLPAGDYTLLPARYALMDGAFLVTKKSSKPVGGIELSDGSKWVSGYLYNGLSSSGGANIRRAQFEVLDGTQINDRAEYAVYSANSLLKASALRLDKAIPQLPTDSGALVFQSSGILNLRGTVFGKSVSGGTGATIDISATGDMVIAGRGSQSTPTQTILDSAVLSSWGADSLLLGGIRNSTSTGTSLMANARNITVDNAGTALAGPELILAANRILEMKVDAEIRQEGTKTSSSGVWTMGDTAVSGSGNGVLLWISSDESADILRSGTTTAAGPNLVIQSGAQLVGNRLILDSTAATTLSPASVLHANVVSLNSGQISIQLNNPGALPPTTGLVLTNASLAGLNSVSSLSFLSYSSLDIYGFGQIGSPALGRLALHSGEIRGFNNGGGTVSISASEISLDNSPGNSGPGSVAALSGTLA
ncbi:MAG: hypothetical protein ACOYM3_34125, partial [Terrimicrobiaceae bacterium]